MKYLGIKPEVPRIAVFDFTSCEGCELQLANKEETLPDFLAALQIVEFREVSSAKGDDYAIALIEGAITRPDEVERLTKIREKAAVLVALGSCACFGGVNRMKNAFSMEDVNREVYGKDAKETMPTRSVKEVVPVDLEIPGCPVSKLEVERIVQHLVWQVPFKFPVYPVCVECKQRSTVCGFEKGQICMGPITRAGCNAPCPAGGLGCWGCRGPAQEANYTEYFQIARDRGFSAREIEERLHFFGGFEEVR
jgi:coenzyme F420-reducing hydrogenase gamma subunit